MEKNINKNCKIEFKNNCNCKKNKFNINNLFEVEHFLTSLRQTSRWVELYKFLK